MLRLALTLAVALAVLAPTAHADVGVNQTDGELSVLSTQPDSGAERARVRLIVEHFADDTRNGVRVRQLGLGDPAITTNDSECFGNPIFNDVVCDASISRIRVAAAEADDVIEIGGSNIGCQPATAGIATDVNLGLGDDTLEVRRECGGSGSGGRVVLHPSFPIVTGSSGGVVGGGGDDRVVAGDFDDFVRGQSGDDELLGSDGNDRLQGDSGDDVLDGGAGDDLLENGDGNDQVRGGNGNDTLTFDFGADFYDGGEGRDAVGYDSLATFTPVSVTLDGQANDGLPGEGDNLVSIERVTGAPGNDTIVGSAAGEDLDGAGGNDQVDGGRGSDFLRGGPGDDLIDAREQVRDTVICGDGRDQVILDLLDVLGGPGASVRSDCERIERFALDDGPPARVVGSRVRIGRDGSVRLRVACPRDAKVACRGRLSLRSSGRSLAVATYRVRLGRSARVGLRLSRAAAARVRAAGAVDAAIRERGASARGPRSALYRLVVA